MLLKDFSLNVLLKKEKPKTLIQTLLLSHQNQNSIIINYLIKSSKQHPTTLFMTPLTSIL